jgi:hypothetical protein
MPPLIPRKPPISRSKPSKTSTIDERKLMLDDKHQEIAVKRLSIDAQTPDLNAKDLAKPPDLIPEVDPLDAGVDEYAKKTEVRMRKVSPAKDDLDFPDDEKRRRPTSSCRTPWLTWKKQYNKEVRS